MKILSLLIRYALDINLGANNYYLFLCSFQCKLTDEPFDISRGIWTPNRRMTDYRDGFWLMVRTGLKESFHAC
jgi:hypothetical protein